jgi:hypothetical protein
MDQSTKVVALNTLATICNVNGSVISGCTFYGKPNED